MADLSVQVLRSPGSTIVRLDGEVSMATADTLEEHLLEVAAPQPRLVVLDMAGVTLVSSVGIGTFLMFQQEVERQGGEVRFAAVRAEVLQVLTAAGLADVLHFRPTVQEALAPGQNRPEA